MLESLVEFVLRREDIRGVRSCIEKMLDELYRLFKMLQSDPISWLLLHRLLGEWVWSAEYCNYVICEGKDESSVSVVSLFASQTVPGLSSIVPEWSLM